MKRKAASFGGKFYDHHDLRQSDYEQIWSGEKFHLAFAVNWRFIIPESVYKHATHGPMVFHDSLLPRYRGFSPTVWAIINGENHTGASLFEISPGVDEGEIIDQIRVPIGPDEKISAVFERVTEAYLHSLEKNIEALISGKYAKYRQDLSTVTYCCRRTHADNRINWNDPAKKIYNLIRAVTRPYQGAFTHLNGSPMTVWEARLDPSSDVYCGVIAGRIVKTHPQGGADVLAGDGRIITLTEVQEGNHASVPANSLIKAGMTLI
jgi:methionyl-tRNA formyltransferase